MNLRPNLPRFLNLVTPFKGTPSVVYNPWYETEDHIEISLYNSFSSFMQSTASHTPARSSLWSWEPPTCSSSLSDQPYPNKSRTDTSSSKATHRDTNQCWNDIYCCRRILQTEDAYPNSHPNKKNLSFEHIVQSWDSPLTLTIYLWMIVSIKQN